jgi:phage recombination protein Bet
MNAITKHEGALALPRNELVRVLGNSLYPGASAESIELVLGYCEAGGFDPMQKPVHIVPMWDGKAKRMRDVVMPGIGLYRTLAARAGCAGITEAEHGPDVTEAIGGVEITYPQWTRVTVKRRLVTGEIVDFTAREFWKENYAVKGGPEKSIAPNAMWFKRPYGQLAKCAEAQALRKAFPEIASQPTADEMEGKTLHVEDHVEAPAACPPELLTKATAAADGGRDTFAAFWKNDIKGVERNLLAPHLADLKSRTEKAEAAKVATVIDAESGEIVEQPAEPSFGDIVEQPA